MRTEQDVDDLIVVWTRYRDEPVVDLQYSDERPDYLVWGLHIALFLACVVVIVVLIYTAVYR